MFKLRASELNGAKAAIEHHGYCTLMPEPPEWRDLVEHWPTVRSHLCGQDLERYTPRQPLVVTAAKDEKSVRLVHLLHPEDMLLYTSLVLIVKNDIERVRLSSAEGRVYSYRASDKGKRLYDSVRDTYGHYRNRLKRKASRRRTRAIAVTDIADFYASISHTQLSRLLKEAAQTRRSAKASKLLVSQFAANFMGREGYGIPTGPMASRLLAEVVLNEIDKHLMAEDIDFVRWVDDYNFFTTSLASAEIAVLDLAAWLYKNYGFTLQSTKTHVLSRSDYMDRILVDIESRLSDRAAVLELLQGWNNDYSETGDDVDELMDDVHAVELIEMLVDAITDKQRVDFRIVNFAARRLQRMPLDRRVGKAVLEVLTENIRQLSPVISMIAPLIVSLLVKQKKPKRIAKSLLQSLRLAKLDHHAVWILTILAESPCSELLNLLIDVYQGTKTDVLTRYTAFAICKSGGRVAFDHVDWERRPPLVRLALLKCCDLINDQPLKLDGSLERVIAGAERG